MVVCSSLSASLDDAGSVEKHEHAGNGNRHKLDH